MADAVRAIIFYLWTGRILEAYWYIPFIMVFFAGSPLVLCFIRLRPTARFLLVGGLFLIALLVQRPVLNLSVLQSVVYFLPVYLFGILVSLHRETVYRYLTGRELHLLLVIVLLALVQAIYYPSFGNLHKQPWVLSLPDILLVQKILLCLFFTVLLNRLENKTIPFLGTLASASFAIYFIHPYLLWGVQLLLDRRYPLLLQLQGPALWLVMTPVVLLVSLGIALGVRSVFKSYSRLVIGW
jgi:surface polysaccharide O-acyltransferase-like enzyme